MKNRLGENIRAYRKARKITQEQLAEAMNVTLSAVSKWETGVTIPDLGTVIALADFFAVSVDVLLGYERYGENIDRVVQNIRGLTGEESFADCAKAAELAIRHYPNAFPVLYYSARMFFLKGVKGHNESDLNRSIDLYEKSLELVSQNGDPMISARTIRNAIAKAWVYLGEEEKALPILMQNNEDGCNDHAIGFLLACMEGREDEALKYISRALVEVIFKMDRLLVAYGNVYANRNDIEKTLDATLGLLEIVDIFRLPDESSYLDKLAARYLAVAARIAREMGRDKEADLYLAEARKTAARYDDAPSNKMTHTRFCEGADGLPFPIDDLDATAAEEVETTFRKDLKAKPSRLVFERY